MHWEKMFSVLPFHTMIRPGQSYPKSILQYYEYQYLKLIYSYLLFGECSHLSTTKGFIYHIYICIQLFRSSESQLQSHNEESCIFFKLPYSIDRQSPCFILLVLHVPSLKSANFTSAFLISDQFPTNSLKSNAVNILFLLFHHHVFLCKNRAHYLFPLLGHFP